MFPLVHYFVNRQIYVSVPPLMALGAIFPDLAAGAGLNRDRAHEMGADFYGWCRSNAPEGLPLAIGVASHGINPQGVDYYSDEFWPGSQKGWCFLQGEPYMPQVAAATRLPEDLIWWKAHNFVEMSYELVTDLDHPELKQELLAALRDHAAQQKAAMLLAAYTGGNPELIIGMFNHAPNIFALTEVSASQLAFKQDISYKLRHNVTNADTAAMAGLIEQMSRELRDGYYPFMKQLIRLTAQSLSDY